MIRVKPVVYIDDTQACSLYGHTLAEWLAGSKLSSKWPFLVQLVREGKAGIYDSGRRSIVYPPYGKWKKLEPFFHKIELLAWLLIHRINPFTVSIVRDLSKLTKHQTVFSFLQGRFNEEGDADRDEYGFCSARKIVHISHFMFYPSNIRRALERTPIDFFIGEANIAGRGSFFTTCFPNSVSKFLVLPFGFANRFRRNTVWTERISKCAVTGTFQKISKQSNGCGEFIEYFNTDTLHSLRRALYENRESLSVEFEIRISNLDKEIVPLPTELPEKLSYGNNRFARLLAVVHRYYIDNLRSHHGRRKYYDFDIVKFYNEHRMFAVPEEVVGLPAIGFVEGMACGAAYVGLVHSMYQDIGMISGVHYIGYDGSLDDLREKVRYYLAHDRELEAIASAGHRFALENLSNLKIKTRFMSLLQVDSPKQKQ